MKRRWILVVNALLIIAVLAFVVLYSVRENSQHYKHQVEAFRNTSSAMEQVTENYLEEEQQICDVWARYISTRNFTLAEVAEFIRSSHVMPTASAHVIYADTLEGLSTRLSAGGGYEVSYKELGLVESLDIAEVGEGINVTRTYINPVNGERSLAFCNRIIVRVDEAHAKDHDPAQGSECEAILLRVLPVSDLENKWVFPQNDYENALFAVIDSEGNYVDKGGFEGESFFEYFDAYNETDAQTRAALVSDVISGTGTFTMKGSKGEKLVVAHTPIRSTGKWVLLSSNPADEFRFSDENRILIIIVSAGLVVLFLIDLAYMRALNRKLQAAAREAEHANRAKTEFLSTMSHDIRTPMNAIIGLTTITGKKLDDREAVGENLRKIGLASNHLLTLINDILDISKVESGKLNLSPLTFPIFETVENLVNLSQPMIKEKNIDFSFHIDRMEKEYLYADQLRLNQIYINLLSNAIKYTEPGGSVCVDMREEQSPKEGCVRLGYRVSDTGIGMSPEFMKKMYQPFSRQTDSRISSIQGTGLGLAITKQMVDLMGGTIECESEQGRGTTFTVTIDLPVADRQREDMRLPPVDVLLVDDDGVLLETAADALESIGAGVDKASSGEEALAMISRRHAQGVDYGVVIVDWRMPGLDGIETVRRIRADVGGSVPVLLISAYDRSDVEEAAREAGANGFISKPLFRSTLFDKISELLGAGKTVEPEDDNSDLAGMRILVAEDNDVNWEIISAMLGMFGIETERAENGRICVDMMKDAPDGKYALIFMDIQMPEMNGLDATRAIRALPEEYAKNIPIVAMTADAFSENVAECLAAGMNGHIAKPVDIKLVIKEIRRIKEQGRK